MLDLQGGRSACAQQLPHGPAVVEPRLLETVRRKLLDAPILAEVKRRIARAIAAKPNARPSGNRLAELYVEISNLAEAIAAGALSSSKALAMRLKCPEADLARLTAQQAERKASVVCMPLQLQARYQRLAANLELELARDVHKARTILRQLIGNEIPVVPQASRKHLVARIGLDTREFLQVVEASEIFMVAGA